MFSLFKNFFQIILLTNKKINHVFYSESKFYQSYFIDFITALSKKYPNDNIIYLSSDNQDVIDLPNVKNFFIGNNFFKFLIFKLIKAKYFFLTLTDLDNHEIKRNNFVENYVYIFHAAASLHKNYTKTAFKNYDQILLIGNHQLKELALLPINKNTKLLKIGYFYFDYLQKKKNEKNSDLNNDTILIAPSWNYNEKNFFTIYTIDLIYSLLNFTNYNIILRPHPEHYKRNFDTIEKVLKVNKKNPRFFLDKEKDCFNSCLNSSLLITDESAILIEYALIFEKPMIFFDKHKKIHNESYYESKLKTIDEEIKEEFGFSVQEPNFSDISKYIDKSKNKMIKKKLKIQDYKKETFFNHNHTIEEAMKFF